MLKSNYEYPDVPLKEYPGIWIDKNQAINTFNLVTGLPLDATRSSYAKSFERIFPKQSISAVELTAWVKEFYKRKIHE